MQPATVALTLVPGRTYLIEVAERDNDALVDVLGPKGELLAESDHPERRTGTRRAVVTATGTGQLTVRVTGKEHANAVGKATVRAFDLAHLQARPGCLAVMKALAAADVDYAAGQAISRGLTTARAGGARDLFLRAVDSYSAAEQALVASGDWLLRGQTQLALAGVEYLGLSDWAKAADWAQTAAATLGARDPYRHARAETLLAQAWMEIGLSAPAHPATQSGIALPPDLQARARTVLRTQSRFYLQRDEKYDAAFAYTNIALTYYNQARFQECVAASTVASRLFSSIRDIARRAQAWMNTALCDWGLGRLPEARQWLKLASGDVGPQPNPSLYLRITNNTGLADYALGDFDESRSLFDRALSVARLTQSRRDESQSLYGIGINFDALGDSTLAREFLYRSLTIRTVALDPVGRMQTLRALATVDAGSGRVEEAIACDHEALGLTNIPATIERIRIQLAMLAAASGQAVQAKAQLDEVISSTARVRPAVQAEARLQRAILLRRMGSKREALADLALARPRLRRLGNATEEFAADLERAKTLRMAGEPREALAAADEALQESDLVRAQTANPELRLLLQTPLRAAYDLKIELLRARYDDALAQGKKQEADNLAAAAFATADASRAHSLADVAAQEYSPEIRRELAREFRRREALYEELAGRRFALEVHLDHVGAGDARTQYFTSDIAELERQLDTINTLIASRAGARTGHVSGDRTLVPWLPADTALISYWLGADSAYAWVVLPASIHWIRLSSPEGITSLATTFHSSLARIADKSVQDRLADARALSERVLRPIEPWVAGVTQWAVIPDGALDYVPFAALRISAGASDEFVVVRHDVVLTPAAWMLDTGGRRAEPPTPRALLLVADPVYQPDDPRLASLPSKGHAIQTPEDSTAEPSGHNYRRLPFTALEAADIVGEFPSGEVDELTGLDATRARLLSLDWSKYRFIHIATHGVVDAQVPDLSALVLGSYDAKGDLVDGALRVADLSLRTLHADLAVFSACDTALGREVPSEGLVGISSTVLARGAKAVVASLWPVSDESGARLMTELYRHMLHDSMSPPAALGSAMRSVVAHNASADPALWAAFQVSVVALGPGLPVRDTRTVETATTTRP
jgi:CHAT domain-containing protein